MVPGPPPAQQGVLLKCEVTLPFVQAEPPRAARGEKLVLKEKLGISLSHGFVIHS